MMGNYLLRLLEGNGDASPPIYEIFRRLFYGRTLDIGTFNIMIRKDITNNTFIFENIYSNEHQLEDDSIHGDDSPTPIFNHPYNHNPP